jgi:ribonuclease Z
MKPSLHARLVNSPFEDPCLYVRLLRERRAFLFDAGFTTNLSAGDILKVRDIFISHTHIDHFIGFDSILRLHLRREGPLRLYGPEGFIDCVQGKLGGYTWNLISEYPLVIEVSEIHGKSVMKAIFRTEDAFMRKDLGESLFDGILLRDSFITVSGVVVDHQIPSLAFSIEEDYHINIDKSKLSEMKLSVGPWLGELKTAIRENRRDSIFMINGKRFAFSELKEIAYITRGQKISYVVDMLGSEDNLNRIAGLVKNSDVLYIETYFSDEDKERARDRYHLTAREAGRIAREAGVGRLEVFHFSPRYSSAPRALSVEAEEEFNRGKSP